MHILKFVYQLGIDNHKTVSNEKDIYQAEPYRLEGGHLLPPSISPLFDVRLYYQTWHDSNMAQNFSKSITVK